MEQRRTKWFATRQVLAVSAAGLGLLAYICFLLVTNYRSELSLRENLVQLQRQQAARCAGEPAYFLADRKEDLAKPLPPFLSWAEVISILLSKSSYL